MSNGAIIVAVLTAILGVAGGASGAAIVNAWAKRKVTSAEANRTTAEADSKVVVTAELLMTRQQEQIDRGDIERAAQREEIKQLREEMRDLKKHVTSLEEERVELLVMAARFRNKTPNLMSMEKFCDRWLQEINSKSAWPRGLHIVLYPDDVDGEVALGYLEVPFEDVPITKILSPEEISMKEEELDRYAQGVRIQAGHPATPPTQGETS